MTWMIIRLLLSLAFVGGVLWFAAKLAKKRGLGGGGAGVIEVVARQRMGRSSSVTVLRIADRVLVVGATDQTITLLGEVDSEAVEEVLEAARPAPALTHAGAHAGPHAGPRTADADSEYQDGPVDGTALPARTPARPGLTRMTTGPASGSVLDKQAWGALVSGLREKTVRR